MTFPSVGPALNASTTAAPSRPGAGQQRRGAAWRIRSGFAVSAGLSARPQHVQLGVREGVHERQLVGGDGLYAAAGQMVPAEIDVGTGDGRWSRRQVILLRHSPSPREIDRAVTSARAHVDGLLFVVPRAGRALKHAAERDHRIAYSAVDEAVVYFQGETYRAGEQQPASPTHPGRTSWTRLAMLRLFALRPAEPLTQSQIARQLGVSHVAVGKQLLLPDELVARTPARWQIVDRAACWNLFMAEYPGPRGLTTYWVATGDLTVQLERIEQVAHDRGDARPAISGDLAADLYAPWRRPSRVVAYVVNQPPLEEHGFATVRPAVATVELRTPRDPTG